MVLGRVKLVERETKRKMGGVGSKAAVVVAMQPPLTESQFDPPLFIKYALCRGEVQSKAYRRSISTIRRYEKEER